MLFSCDIGYKTVQGFLASESIRVQRDRIRESMHRLNPTRQALRSMTSIRRRSYQVQSPLALWHIDGNHKLVRYVEIPITNFRRRGGGRGVWCKSLI